MKGAVIIDAERCKGCRLCVVACPKETLAISTTQVNHHGYSPACVVKAESCIGCAQCAIVCPDGCISVYRAKE